MTAYPTTCLPLCTGRQHGSTVSYPGLQPAFRSLSLAGLPTRLAKGRVYFCPRYSPLPPPSPQLFGRPSVRPSSWSHTLWLVRVCTLMLGRGTTAVLGSSQEYLSNFTHLYAKWKTTTEKWKQLILTGLFSVYLTAARTYPNLENRNVHFSTLKNAACEDHCYGAQSFCLSNPLSHYWDFSLWLWRVTGLLTFHHSIN